MEKEMVAVILFHIHVHCTTILHVSFCIHCTCNVCDHEYLCN